MSTPLPDIRFRVDRDGRILECTASFFELLEISPSAFVGRKIGDVVPEKLSHTIMAALDKETQKASNLPPKPSLATLRDACRYEFSLLTAAGPAQATFDVIFRVSEATELAQTEEKLKLAERRLRLWSDNSDDVIWTMAMDGSITYVSPAVETMRGYTPAEAMQQSIDEILTPASQAESLNYYLHLHEALSAGQPPMNYRGDQEYKCKDGTTVWTEVLAYPLLDSDGKLIELIGVTRDITARKKYEQELKEAWKAADDANKALELANAELSRIATTDVLTGARNRRQFEVATEIEIVRARRSRLPLSLIYFDIDYFKSINDRYGHHVGDEVLVEVAELAKLHLRASDVLARWGGEEFVILLPDCASSSAMAVAEKMRNLLEAHSHPIAGKLTASFGVAELRPGETLEQWINRADTAMYAAKAAGRNLVKPG